MKGTTKNIENGIIMSPTTSLEEQIRVLRRMTQSGKSLPREEDIPSTAGVRIRAYNTSPRKAERQEDSWGFLARQPS